MEEEYPGNAPAETVPNAIRRKVSEYPNNTAVKFKETESGKLSKPKYSR